MSALLYANYQAYLHPQSTGNFVAGLAMMVIGIAMSFYGLPWAVEKMSRR